MAVSNDAPLSESDIASLARGFHSWDPALIGQVWPVMHRLRGACPVFHSEVDNGFWVVAGYDEAKRVLQDSGTFSSHAASTVPAYPEGAALPSMPPIHTDPPRQGDFRRILNPFLSPAAIAKYEPVIRRIVRTLVSSFIDEGRCDFIGQLARPFPARMLYETMFGITDPAEVERCAAWTHKANYGRDDPDFADALRAWQCWILQLIADRRASGRSDDMLDALIFGTVEGEPITESDLLGVVMILILGGFGTTAEAGGWMMYALARDQALQDHLRRNPDEIAGSLDEFLRIEPPVINIYRICRRDAEVGGQRIHEGERVVVHLGSANRDPAVFTDPDMLDLGREANKHLTFGLGPHRCVGSHLARMNLRILFEEVLSRMERIELDRERPPTQLPTTAAWGLDSLPITFVVAAGPEH